MKAMLSLPANPNRGPLTSRVRTRLTKGENDALKEVAAEMQVSKAEVIRRILERHYGENTAEA